MSTVAQRIEWILRHQSISARELARRSGLVGATVSNLLKTLADDPDAVTLRTLRQIAKGADVPYPWLVVGEEAASAAAAPVLPARAEAAKLAEAEGVWSEAIRSVMSEEPTPDAAAQPTKWWLLRMQIREVEMLEEARRRLAKMSAPRALPSKKEPR